MLVLIIFSFLIAFLLGRTTKPEPEGLISSFNNQDNSTLEQNEPTELLTEEQKNQKHLTSGKNNFIFPDKRNGDMAIQRKFLQLDYETRMIVHYIQNNELERAIDQYGVNIEVDENGRLIFEEMDIPDLAVTLNLPKGSPLQLTSGYVEGDYFSFYYYYNPDDAENATDLFVQYKQESGDWKLVNIRTNH